MCIGCARIRAFFGQQKFSYFDLPRLAYMCVWDTHHRAKWEKKILLLSWIETISYERRTQRIKILIMWQTFWQQFCIVYNNILLIFSSFITFPWIYLLFLFSGYSATRKELQRRIYVWNSVSDWKLISIQMANFTVDNS